ncbi:esterase/lipase family protein [Streptomyces sp. NPDC057854]|uniref:esterase/lipase family protein n=1 Tax=unclassified Streptomyces TaxID=2593676 RepID=UPI003675839F
MNHDLVVFVPGILGSRLRSADGTDVWDLSLRVAGRVLLRGTEEFFARLTLPPGLGTGEPEDAGEGRLEPAGLLLQPRSWPGLMPHVAYQPLRKHLDRAGAAGRNRVVTFAYDWRLSNEVSARRLAAFVARELDEWRDTCRRAGVPDEPRVVLVAHSMGGLVALSYLELYGGRDTARSLVTIGTPYSGAVKAVQALTGAFPRRKLLGVPARLRERLVAAARSMPAVHELLPTYQCVTGDPDGTRLDTVPLPDLDTAAVRHAFAFRARLDEAQRRNRAADAAAGRPAPYTWFAAGGRGTPTAVTLSRGPGGLAFADRLPGDPRWQGDGTVSCLSATPPAWESGARMDWYGLGHTELANDPDLHLQLQDRYDALDHRRFQAGDRGFGLDLPEAVTAGTPFEIGAVSEEERLLLDARIHDPATGETAADLRLRPDGEGGYRATAQLPPGVWTVEVTAPRVRALAPRRETLLVLEESA